MTGHATDETGGVPEGRTEEAPGDAGSLRTSLWKYSGGLGLSIVLTLAAFWVSGTTAIWPGGVPVMLAALAIGQMGVHLVLFLHVSSGPEGTNTILALAFGVFVVALVVFGSLVIMGSLDGMLPSGG
ncbi:MAG: cytochrome o ubiquinol oxidase subunit IV [Variovorax sp.]|jgi:cytochrome o ubiquinol oxidase operon protein cyoD|nr:MAG: cytochrome o ubiquinol oxidase subunit IV [Variovorax sp.]